MRSQNGIDCDRLVNGQSPGHDIGPELDLDQLRYNFLAKRTEVQLALIFLFLPSITLCYPIIILCPDTLGINHRTLLSSEPWCYLLSGQRRPSVGQHAEMLGPTFYWSHWRWHYCDITRSHRAPGHCEDLREHLVWCSIVLTVMANAKLTSK